MTDVVGWIITKDHITPSDDSSYAVGIIGPRACPFDSLDEFKASGLSLVRFKMFDDDIELYYSGYLIDDDDCASQEYALFEFGMGYAGCTHIQVLRDGAWVEEIA